MKKLLIILIGSFSACYCYGQLGDYTVKANIKGLRNDTIYVWYYPLTNSENIQRDTLISANGRFEYKLPISEPSLLAILPNESFYKRRKGNLYMPQTKFIELLVTPEDRLEVQGILTPYHLKYSVQGSVINQDYAELQESYLDKAIAAVKIELQIDSISGNKDRSADVDELFNRRGKLFNEIARIKTEYVLQYPGQDLSAYVLSRLSLDTFAKYYPQLSLAVRQGLFSPLLQQKYQTYIKYTSANSAEKALVEGKEAPNFTLTDIGGKSVSLADFKGKFVVLDFWGTWCAPCIRDIPLLKAFNEKYGKSIQVIGIACDDKETEWKKTVSKYQLEWTQLINTSDNDISVLYGIKAYPTKVVIDKNLRIVNRFIGSNEEFYKAMEELLK